jgi:hypothetical protein
MGFFLAISRLFTLLLDDHFGYSKNSSTTPEPPTKGICTLNQKPRRIPHEHRFCFNCLTALNLAVTSDREGLLNAIF